MSALEKTIPLQPFWNNFPPEYVPLLVQCAAPVHFRTGEQIFLQGYDADAFYLILTGKVALESPYVPGEGVFELETLGPGEPLGWSWLFPPHTWHFGAKAIEPTEAIVFRAESLLRNAKENPDFGNELFRRIGPVLLHRLQATRRRLLEICEMAK